MAGARAARWSSPMKSISRSVSFVPVVRCSSHRLFRAVSLLASVSAFSVGGFAQNAAPNDQNGSRRQRGGDNANGGDNGFFGQRGSIRGNHDFSVHKVSFSTCGPLNRAAQVQFMGLIHSGIDPCQQAPWCFP